MSTDDRRRMVNGKHLGHLMTVLADYSHPERRLGLTFTNGRRVASEVRLGPPIEVSFYSRHRIVRPVLSRFSAALSEQPAPS